MQKPRLPLLALLCVALSQAVPAGQASDQDAESGWLALRQGDGNRAAIVFEEALKQSPSDPLLHFGAGAAAYLLGRHGDAADSLNRALTIQPRLTPAVELLGQIEYLQGHLAEAIQRYEEALAHAPDDGGAAMRKRLDAWRKEAAVHRDLTTSRNARFSVAFNGRTDNSLAVHAEGVLERAFWRIAENIGAYPSNRVIVTLYTEQQFREITHGPAWSVGAFDGKVRIPVRGVAQDRGQFDRVLVHELTHAIIHGLAPQGVPAWLHEGLASYFEAEDVAVAQRRAQASGVVIPLAELQESFGRLNAAQAMAAYDQSLVAADLLARTLGTRMAVLLRAMGRGQSFSQAMGSVNLRASDFEEQLRNRLKP